MDNIAGSSFFYLFIYLSTNFYAACIMYIFIYLLIHIYHTSWEAYASYLFMQSCNSLLTLYTIQHLRGRFARSFQANSSTIYYKSFHAIIDFVNKPMEDL